MPANTTIDQQSFWMKHRFKIILISMLLLLPPLAVIFQISGDTGFCGTWCPRMFFSWRKGMSGGEFLMGFARSYLGVALVVGILASTYFLGRYWCSHICPVGGAMEAGSRLVPKFLKINYSAIPAPSVRYGYLLVYLLAPAIGIGSICCNYCNFATIPRLFGAAFSQADLSYFLRTAGLINLGLVASLGFFAKGGRGYCNFLCPIGALDALSNRIGARFGKRVRIESSKCNGCGACVKSCPTWAIEKEGTGTISINQLSCMPCRICENTCPQGAITYGKTPA
jgi:Pyruvate/2-oxoacid:ferredoxin oxidoreductase delta subunit